MPTGSFNVSALLSRLGKKNVVEMPVSDTIQTVLPIRSMAGQVPPHIGRLAMFGGASPAAVGEYSSFEFVALDPGGALILAVFQAAAALQVVVITRSGPIAWGAAGPVPHPAQQFGSEISQSSYWSGTVVAAPSTTDPFITEIQPGIDTPLYLPRGLRLHMTARAANAAINLTVVALGISATQSEPS